MRLKDGTPAHAAKLIEDMRAEARRMTDIAIQYKQAGQDRLCEDHRRAAEGIYAAVNMMNCAYAGEREARESA